MVMNRPKSDLGFKGMSVIMKTRDIFSPRERILGEVGIKPGFHVLDYGCGPGSYLLPTRDLIGDAGKIYALDIHPLAVRKVQELASKKGLANVETILSERETGLPDAGIDVALLYDIFHMLDDPEGVLKELHRVLKPEGTLSFSDHHMKEDKITSGVTGGGLFKLVKKGKKTYSFVKN
jgi:ubiquinone/menaquinone biosynthesis C-methylase UbiE